MSSQKKSTLLTKYKYLYEKNPRSKVFAPLAESYRKLGMFKEGIQVLRDGLKYHPSYTLAYIVLANIYYDEGHCELAYSTVRSFIANNLENITLQKLFGTICLDLNKYDEALETYKLLLLLNPKDQDVIEKVAMLEDKLNYALIVDEERVPTTDIFDDKDDWVQVDFNNRTVVEGVEEKEVQEEPKIEHIEESKDDVDQWQQEKIDFDSIEVQEHDLSSDFYLEDYDNDSDEVITPEDDSLTEEVAGSNEILSHTLVDLYYSQGHVEKSIGLLEEILNKFPEDEKTLEKLNKYRLEQKADEDLDVLLDDVDQKLISRSDKRIESLNLFLDLIKDKAKNYEDTHH